MALLNSPSSKSLIWTRDRISSPSRSHFSPGLKLILRTQVTNPEIATFQSLSKGVYEYTTVYICYTIHCSVSISARQNQYMLVAILSHHYFFLVAISHQWLNKPLNSFDKCKEINSTLLCTAGLCHCQPY